MLPPLEVLTNRRNAREDGGWKIEHGAPVLAIFYLRIVLALAIVATLAGCAPSGPRELLKGKELIDKRQFERAIERLKTATSLMKTNAQAFNYLGIAYQGAGQVTNAAAAYQRALTFDPDLAEARFNLGCLWLEQNRADKLDAAKAELTAYTLRRPHAREGWLKLGTAQLRSRDWNNAERSFNEALRLHAQNAEALNGLGMVALQRNRPRDAAQFFTRALQQQPGYRPALLNLAIVSQAQLNNRPFALEKYREYLALTPRGPEWESVNATARALEQELKPSARPAAADTVAPTNAPAPAAKPVTNTAPKTNLPPPRAEVPANPVVRSAPTSAPPVQTVVAPTTNYEVVTVPPEPVIKTNPNPLTAAPTNEPVVVQSRASNNPVSTPVAEAKTSRGFFQRINPLNLFRSEPKPNAGVTPLSSGPEGSARENDAPRSKTNDAAAVASAAPQIPRYSYRSPPKPAPGNRRDAERLFAQGVQAQRASRPAEAMQAYRQAAQVDPAYFEAYYNLGLAAAESGSSQQSLAAYENALAVRPDSSDARYNFALVLKQSGYLLDAANELERVCLEAPKDPRAHLAVGNLYAQQLQKPAKAREHYLKVLEAEPRHPEATAIRFWLSSNPP